MTEWKIFTMITFFGYAAEKEFCDGLSSWGNFTVCEISSWIPKKKESGVLLRTRVSSVVGTKYRQKSLYYLYVLLWTETKGKWLKFNIQSPIQNGFILNTFKYIYQETKKLLM